MANSKAVGFTLIELMVVVAIVAILAAIALPAFTEQVRQSRRADALAVIGETQLRLERRRAENPSYAGVADPADSRFYSFRITNTGETNYTITASPINAQRQDRCGNLVLTNNAGCIARSASADRCWPQGPSTCGPDDDAE